MTFEDSFQQLQDLFEQKDYDQILSLGEPFYEFQCAKANAYQFYPCFQRVNLARA